MILKTLFKVITGLKNIPRTGWVQRGIHHSLAETVAGHSFETALYVLALSSKIKKIERFKALAMALVHDLAEYQTGDLPKPLFDVIPNDIRRILEEAAVSEVLNRELLDIFKEYLRGESIEAKLVKLSNLLATIAEGYRYKRLGFSVDDIIESSKEGISEIISSDNRFKDIESIINEFLRSLAC